MLLSILEGKSKFGRFKEDKVKQSQLQCSIIDWSGARRSVAFQIGSDGKLDSSEITGMSASAELLSSAGKLCFKASRIFFPRCRVICLVHNERTVCCSICEIESTTSIK